MMRVTGLLVLVVVGLASVTANAIDPDRVFDDPAQQARYQRLISEIRCLTCQNQSIKDSNAPLAVDLREVVRDMIAAGRTDRDIYAFMQQRYGDFALYKPPFSAKSALLWLSPLVLMLIGAGVFFTIVRRRSGMRLDVDGD
ncbi:MAG: cytochrome c-type biogenesis protein [Pseudomonadota bacterium]